MGKINEYPDKTHTEINQNDNFLLTTGTEEYNLKIDELLTYHKNESPHISNIEDLSNVEIGSVEDFQLLIYDAYEGKWINDSLGIADLSDTNLGEPQNGQMIQYNDTESMWSGVNGASTTFTIDSTTYTFTHGLLTEVVDSGGGE